MVEIPCLQARKRAAKLTDVDKLLRLLAKDIEVGDLLRGAEGVTGRIGREIRLNLVPAGFGPDYLRGVGVRQ
jgi:hypothetical protein